MVRQNNEDSAYAGPRLLALADGMGGHAAGEVASQLMIAALSKLDDDQPDADLLEALRSAMNEGNASIAEEVEANPATEGMGTTLTSMLFDGRRAGVCHVGDSRGYLLRDGELIRITRDDTYVQSLVDEGQITADEASMHPQRSLILKALAGRPVEPSLQYREVHEGDRYLLCSDGLSDPVSEETIRDTLSEGSPAEAADRLISLALRSGGPDNVTLVIADVVDSAHPTPSQPSLAGALGDPAAESPRPDTAAGRAAATRPAAEQSRAVTSTPTGADPTKGRWLVIAAVALGIIAVSVAGFFGWQRVNETYYVAATGTDPQVIEIREGIEGDVLGMTLNSHHQYVCLNGADEVSLVEPGVELADATCPPMRVKDLNQVGQSILKNGLPADSYDKVTSQLKRLAGQALPICPEQPADKPGAEPGDTRGTPAPGSRPGENCREVTQ
nr:PP2C family serine/threonine-protein phosphatase [Corynebacterium sp. TAE3-ERU12]